MAGEPRCVVDFILLAQGSRAWKCLRLLGTACRTPALLSSFSSCGVEGVSQLGSVNPPKEARNVLYLFRGVCVCVGFCWGVEVGDTAGGAQGFLLLCTQRSLLMGLGGSSVVSGIELRSATHKASASPIVLSLRLHPKCFVCVLSSGANNWL